MRFRKLGEKLRRGPTRVLCVGVLFLTVATGCDITAFIVPSAVQINTQAKLQVVVESIGTGAFPYTLHVMLRVPDDWTPVSEGYSGIANGVPAQGIPTRSVSNPSADCDFSTFPGVGSAPVGFQDVWYTESFAGTFDSDKGTLTANFTAGSTTGSFTLLTATAIDDLGSPGGGGCIESMTSQKVTVQLDPTSIPMLPPGAWLVLALLLAGSSAWALRARGA